MAGSDVGKGLELREYRPGDEPGIIDLMKDNWTYLRSPDALRYWTWLYTGSAYGKALVVLGTHDHRIVGHYAMFPLTMRVGDALVSGGKAEGSVIREEFRGNIAPKLGLGVPEYRLFGELVHSLFESASKRGVKLIWGFPNEAALKPQVRAGYSYHPIIVQSRVLPFDCSKTAELVYSRAPLGAALKKLLMFAGKGYCRLRTLGNGKRRRTTVTGVRTRRLAAEDLNERYTEFLKRCARKGTVTIEREPEYVRWRFLKNPVVPHEVYVSERDGRITSMIVTDLTEKNGVRSASIVDVLAVDGAEDDLLTLVADVAARKKSEGCVCVRTWMSDCRQSREYLKVLRRAGFFSLPTGVRKGRLHLIYKVLEKSVDAALIAEPDRWYITMAFTEGTS